MRVCAVLCQCAWAVSWLQAGVSSHFPDVVERESLSSAQSTVTPAEVKKLFTFQEAEDGVVAPIAPGPQESIVQPVPSPPRAVVGDKSATSPVKPVTRNIDSEEFLACHRQYIDEVRLPRGRSCVYCVHSREICGA
jgi:hypothetical protein